MRSDELESQHQSNQLVTAQPENAELTLLRSELTEMRRQLGIQNAELHQLRQQLSTAATSSVSNQPTSRRTMLKRVGGAAAGLAALSLAAGLNPVAALADEPAIDADGTGGATPSYGGRFAGNLAQIQLVPAASTGRTTGTHVAGEIYADTNNNLYYYNGTSWNQLNTQVQYLATPLRLVGLYNSNFLAPNPPFPTITAGTSASFPIAGFTVTNNNPGGTITGTIPANATGVIGTLTIINAPSGGYATIYPADLANAPSVASINYPPASGTFPALSNSVSVKLGPIPAAAYGQPAGTPGIKIYCQQSCQVGFDVIAYTF